MTPGSRVNVRMFWPLVQGRFRWPPTLRSPCYELLGVIAYLPINLSVNNLCHVGTPVFKESGLGLSSRFNNSHQKFTPPLPELEQFTVDARRAPQRIVHTHLPD